MARLATELQKGVFAALTTSADLISLFGETPRVYDRVPTKDGRISAKFPYITLGNDQIVGRRTECSNPADAYVTVECWSQPETASKLEVKALADAVQGALDANITLSGFTVVTSNFENAVYRREPDGLTERAIVTFLYRIAPQV